MGSLYDCSLGCKGKKTMHRILALILPLFLTLVGLSLADPEPFAYRRGYGGYRGYGYRGGYRGYYRGKRSIERNGAFVPETSLGYVKRSAEPMPEPYYGYRYRGYGGYYGGYRRYGYWG